MSATSTDRVLDAVALSRPEARVLMTVQNDAFLDLLHSLAPEQFDLTTDCAPWTVKDIAAHLLGWAEAVTSLKELTHQYTTAFKRRDEFAGNMVDAQNQVQVDERTSLSPSELVARLESALPRFARLRSKIGGAAVAIPIYDSNILGRTNLAYLVNTIFTRDIFMHRIDIARATGAELVLGPREARLIEDVLVDWARRRQADATVHLTGPAGGSYRVGGGSRAVIEGDAIDMARVLAGRGRVGELRISGDVPAAERWLTQGCPF